MNSPSVSILCKSAIEAVLLIATMEFFNNSISRLECVLKLNFTLSKITVSYYILSVNI